MAIPHFRSWYYRFLASTYIWKWCFYLFFSYGFLSGVRKRLNYVQHRCNGIETLPPFFRNKNHATSNWVTVQLAQCTNVKCSLKRCLKEILSINEKNKGSWSSRRKFWAETNKKGSGLIEIPRKFFGALSALGNRLKILGSIRPKSAQTDDRGATFKCRLTLHIFGYYIICSTYPLPLLLKWRGEENHIIVNCLYSVKLV